jgi:Cu(I)/Ag(I) efflux system membrane protein CusA/SilA
MLTAPLLSMFVIPAAYLLMRRPRESSPENPRSTKENDHEQPVQA